MLSSGFSCSGNSKYEVVPHKCLKYAILVVKTRSARCNLCSLGFIIEQR